MRHIAFSTLLDHLSGRTDERVGTHLAQCDACRGQAAAAKRMLAAGRRAMAAPQPTRKALRRAVRAFRQERKRTEGASLLRLVLDSLLQPAPALRATAVAPARFLRFEGALTLELQQTDGPRGVDLHGQIAPPDFAPEVVLVVGGRTRRTRVSAEGTFVLRRVPKREIELRIGAARVTGLRL